MLQAGDHLRIPLRELQISFARSSGPGGQNVNKVSSKAILRWGVARSPSLPPAARRRFLERFPTRVSTAGEVILSSDRHRDQGRNVADCLEKLRGMLAAIEHPPTPRRATRPSRAARERRLEEKRAVSERKRQRSPRAPRGFDD